MIVSKVQPVKYIDGILTQKNVDEYIPMVKTRCRSYRPPTVNVVQRGLNTQQKSVL